MEDGLFHFRNSAGYGLTSAKDNASQINAKQDEIVNTIDILIK